MKIFIAGCARSGTSLTRGLMGCFRDTYTLGQFGYGDEAHYTRFATLDRPEAHVVVKRDATSHVTLARLPADIGLIYCVRHPFDTLTSRHPDFPRRRYYVSEPRWRAEYAALQMLRALQPERRIFVLRYEDLVGDPDGTQQRIADHFGLKAGWRFSQNPAGVRVRRTSVEKWRADPELRAYLDTFDPPFLAIIRSFAKEFGYALPLIYAEWFPPALRRRTRGERLPRIRRLEGNPIVRPEMLAGTDGGNINGPSLIAAPRWLPGRLGKYYLYFAHHQGKYIRLAYADSLSGPWTIHAPGTLHLAQAPMCRGHIASPDVHVDHKRRRIRMYFHGPVPGADGDGQRSFVATSRDGLRFRASREVLSGSYLRVFRRKGEWFGIDQAGYFYRSRSGLKRFVRRDAAPAFVFSDIKAAHEITLRHLAVRREGAILRLYYTRRGDAPERIWRCSVDLTPDWKDWRIRDEQPVLWPELPWEGAGLPVTISRPGPADGFENALRDPAVFVEKGQTYLLYAIAGEAGIAIARIG